MIKPSDLKQIPQGNPADRDAIECHIDDAIREHHKARRLWPLVIQKTRDGWSAEDIEAVLTKYRDAGWTAMSGARDTMAVLAPASSGGAP